MRIAGIAGTKNFGRSCGENLRRVTQPLADYALVSNLEKTPAVPFRSGQGRIDWRLWGFIVMLIGVAIGVICKGLSQASIAVCV